MKLFRIRGGIHPEDRKALSAERPVEDMPLPDLLHIPLHQHAGTPAKPEVEAGQKVLKGQLLAKDHGPVSAAIHAPTSGEVLGIGLFPAPHPSGLQARTITLKPDGLDRWGDPLPPLDPETCAPEAISARVAACGVVGMGGGTFPSAIKLNLRGRYPDLHTLLLNGAECEPYLTCDDRLMREQAADVVDGARIMARALGVARAVIAIERNKPHALAAMHKAAAAFADVTVVGVPTRYPMGSEKHLVQSLTGLETPGGGLTADIGYVVHNVATAVAVREAVRLGRPLVSRIVTVTGGAVRRPSNLRVLLGTPISDILDHCGGFSEKPARLLNGGPMMGQPLPGTEVPVVKGMNGVLALTAKEAAERAPAPCVRCGTCVDICPCGLVPLEMAAHIRKDDIQAAVRLGLNDCMSCGSCSYVCPSHIPLVQFFNHGKGKLKVLQAEDRRKEGNKLLEEKRTARLEEDLRRKKEMLARRKAEAEAKKKAAEAAKAAKEAAAQAGPAPAEAAPSPEDAEAAAKKEALRQKALEAKARIAAAKAAKAAEAGESPAPSPAEAAPAPPAASGEDTEEAARKEALRQRALEAKARIAAAKAAKAAEEAATSDGGSG